ncbi:MAG: hypothetical protein AAFU63_12075, partial [Pseudomonadota bacterium]
ACVSLAKTSGEAIAIVCRASACAGLILMKPNVKPFRVHQPHLCRAARRANTTNSFRIYYYLPVNQYANGGLFGGLHSAHQNLTLYYQ